MPHDIAKPEGDTLEIGAGALKVRATGSDVSRVLAISTVLGLILWAVYEHHNGSREMLQRILEATSENTYVLSLSQVERERLNIAMPESLRRKVRRSRDGE